MLRNPIKTERSKAPHLQFKHNQARLTCVPPVEIISVLVEVKCGLEALAAEGPILRGGWAGWS